MEKEYTQQMREIFRYKGYLSKQEVYKKITEFNTSTIITTNYNCLIEKATEDNGKVIRVIGKVSYNVCKSYQNPIKSRTLALTGL